MKTKTKSDLIKECLIQIRGVFQHYADQKIPQENLDKIKESLEDNIPNDFTTESWSEYAEMKERERNE